VNVSGDTIIVGVDGTERSRDALALAELLAGAAGGRLLIAHVHNYGQVEGLLSGGEYETLLREVAESTAAGVRELLGDQRAHDMRLVAARSPAAGLQDFAQREAASLIVVGSSHRSSVGRVQPGGVGQRLLAGAPVAVAIAPLGYAGRPRRLDTVGCGFDGSDDSHRALEWAAALARRADAALRVVAVHEPMAFSNVPTGAVGGESANKALRRTLRTRLDEAVAKVGSEVPTEAVFSEGRGGAGTRARSRAAGSARAGLARLRSAARRPAGQRVGAADRHRTRPDRGPPAWSIPGRAIRGTGAAGAALIAPIVKWPRSQLNNLLGTYT
jgi:nucleotide-binding universal stress UspA family protein